jgi:hypothetical protein
MVASCGCVRVVACCVLVRFSFENPGCCQQRQAASYTRTQRAPHLAAGLVGLAPLRTARDHQRRVRAAGGALAALSGVGAALLGLLRERVEERRRLRQSAAVPVADEGGEGRDQEGDAPAKGQHLVRREDGLEEDAEEGGQDEADVDGPLLSGCLEEVTWRRNLLFVAGEGQGG